MVDWLPVLSQTKSLIQWAGGNEEGAELTQDNFLNRCPVVAQVRSVVLAVRGDGDGALHTQLEFLDNCSLILNSVPVVGHLKGGFHFFYGDLQGAGDAVILATRSTGVMVGGIGGMVIAGPVGACAGGLVAGIAMDTLVTGVESLVNEEMILFGYLDSVNNMREGQFDLTDGIDFTFGLISDSIGGYTAGRCFGKAIVQQGLCQSGAKEKGTSFPEREMSQQLELLLSRHWLSLTDFDQEGSPTRSASLSISMASRNQSGMSSASSPLAKRRSARLRTKDLKRMLIEIKSIENSPMADSPKHAPVNMTN